MTEAPTTPPQSNAANMQAKRKKSFAIFGAILAIVAVGYAIWAFFLNHSVSTDNAYVGAETASITSMVNGQVQQVLVKDTQQVKQGDVLVQIDDRDAKIAVAAAQAELTKAKRQYKQTRANSNALNSQVFVSDDGIHSAEAQVQKAQVDLGKAEKELLRRQQLSASGAISKEELSSAEIAVANAQASLSVSKAALAQAKSSQKAAQSTLAANDALILDSDENSTPDVLIAETKLKQALLDLERTQIKAPLDGVVARRNIQVGQRVAPGTVMMMVVPVSQLYVDANFKESQLEKVRAGQR